MHLRNLTILGLLLLLILSAAWVTAQDNLAVSAASCAPTLDTFWVAASDACVGGPVGYICNGGSTPQVEPSGAVGNALASVGAMVEIGLVDSIRTVPLVAETGSAGIAWLRPNDPIRFTGLLLGDVTVRDAAPEGFPAWQSMLVQTGAETQTCGAAPRNTFVVQTPLDQPTNIAINGVSLGLNGTLLIQTSGDTTVFAALSGETLVFAFGQNQLLRTGQQVGVSYSGGNFATPISAPTLPQLFEAALGQNLPTGLLDRPVIVPQAGFVSTEGAVNMRIAPSTDAAVMVQVPAGVNMAVLGRNPAGDWLHVRLDTGETGWMYASLLLQNIGAIDTVYEATPLPPPALRPDGNHRQNCGSSGGESAPVPGCWLSVFRRVAGWREGQFAGAQPVQSLAESGVQRHDRLAVAGGAGNPGDY
ncbi:MAG TPA: SH3 domain-containing protein [Phototrophicaceae bacterium]|nr:SH3 domain-containing protein [Phototrophicaceae bacterium]